MGQVSNLILGTTAGISTIAALSSADVQFVEHRQQLIQQSKQNPKTSMLNALKSFGGGVLDGVAGVVKEPIREIKQDGIAGTFKGLGKAAIGLVTKPISGAADAVGHIGLGVKAVTRK